MTPLPSSKATRVQEIKAGDLDLGVLWVVVFGPGHGEAIVVRLPDGGVGVVDGCHEPLGEHSEGCPVTRLLRSLNVSTLLFACLTHPHADHYRGFARLLEEFEGKTRHVWHVFGLTPQERKALVGCARRHFRTRGRTKSPDDAEPQKMDRVIERIVGSGKWKKPAYRRELFVDRSLIQDTVNGSPFDVTAWGPTDADVLDARMRYLGQKARGARYEKNDLPNQVSGALLVRWGEARVLLAGDLFAHKRNEQRGWGPARELARELAERKASVQVVNVAHHASHNAHDDKLWTAMQPSLAIVTPFLRAAGVWRKLKKKTVYQPRQPPRPEDIRRLLAGPSHCEVAITSEPDWLDKKLSPSPPVRREVGPVTPVAPSPPMGTSPLLAVAPPVAFDDTRNAVAVALNSKGEIVKVLLAGDADFYA